MKNFIWVIVATGLIVCAGWVWQARQAAAVTALGGLAMPGSNETYAEKLARYRRDVDQTVREACTNNVVGLRSIISLNCDTTDDNYKNWVAQTTFEFINKVGGVERANLEFRFASLDGSKLQCYVNLKKRSE